MEESAGSVVVAPEVLSTIVRLVTLETPGVVRLSSNLTGRMTRALRGKKSSRGIDVQIEDGAATVDVCIVAEREVALLSLGQSLQREISRALSDMVGLPVRAVNVHIDDVTDPYEAGSTSPILHSG